VYTAPPMPNDAPYRDGLPQAKPQRPPSATNFGLNSIALVIVLATILLLRTRTKPFGDEVLVLCGAVAIPVVAMDIFILKVHRRASTGLNWDQTFAPDFGRVLTKLLGLFLALAPFALFYWMTPEYNGSFYDPLYRFLRRFAVTFAVSAPLYIFIVDGQMRQPRDAYWQLGRVALGGWRDAKKADIANLYRTWLVKAYFVPIMFVWLNGSTRNVVSFDLGAASWSNLRAYDFLYDFIFFIDLLFCTVGYAMSFRVTDSHVRTAEPTMLGWTVALFCYPPFYNLMSRQYVPYDSAYFGKWLEPHPALRWAWAIVILGLITIYVLATVAFGVRFSNLTHRGILTNGPYRYTKHPAYVSKNISWWMASVPFLLTDGNPLSSLKRCMALGIINFMYFMRAKTEERHLSRDPIYVAYATWMNDHGVLKFLNRVPIFRYKPPATPVHDAVAAIQQNAGESPESPAESPSEIPAVRDPFASYSSKPPPGSDPPAVSHTTTEDGPKGP
jgi:protein-S-isoprenylcysteine O-methyltransferase Ste14